jgi:Skp family chaperone for outer membrane proteins
VHDGSITDMAEKVPGWLERVLIPQISDVKGELKAMNARINGPEGKMEGEFKAVHSEIRRVEEKLDTKIDELDKRLDVTQRLAVVEEQVKELLGMN